MERKSFHLLENKWCWITTTAALFTLADKEALLWYGIVFVFCTTLFFSLIRVDSPGECIRGHKVRSFLLLLFGVVTSNTALARFYQEWEVSTKLAALASRLHCSAGLILWPIVLIGFLCTVFCIFILMSSLLNWNQREENGYSGFATILLASILTFQYSQRINCVDALSPHLIKVVAGTLIILALIALVNAVTARFRVSILIGSFAVMLLSTTNYFVLMFRGRELGPPDFLSVGTAMNVVGNYRFSLPTDSALCWLLWLLFVIALFLSGRSVSAHPARIRGISGAICVLSVLAVYFSVWDTPVKLWGNRGSEINGTLLNFVLQIRDSVIQKPENYSPSVLEQLERQYITEDDASDNDYPSIIVIMDESFTDFSVLGNDVQTEDPLLPFISSMEENTICGYVYSSVFGSNTANSEFEFLTGNSMAFLPAGSVPYQQYLSEDQYSLVSFLQSIGYRCLATHPYLENGWNRPNVYGWFGFDEVTFLPDYPQSDLVREYVSDREMFEYVIRRYEERDRSAAFFLFGITMQNHGGYYVEGFDATVSLHYQDPYPGAEQFLTLANLTDRAVEYLIEYFSAVEEPVVVCFFGDHQPKVENEFFEEVHGGAFDSLESEMLKYKVPFFIWANYDIEEQRNVETSINYLSSFVLEACGIELPAYNQFLRAAEQSVPILTAEGYYSADSGRFLDISEAEGEEKAILNQYHVLEYNNMFDKKHLSGVFRLEQ